MAKKHEPFIDKNGEVRSLRVSDKVVFVPLRDVFPELAEFAAKRKRGRPKSATTKQLLTFKLSPDVVEGIRNSGVGYNVRVEKVLRDALEDGRI